MENPVSEPVLTPVQVPEPKTKFPVMYLVLSFLILVLLASTAFLYYQNMQLKNMLANYQNQPAVSPTPITYQSPVPTTDPTANWKTYSNFGVTFKYPIDLVVTKEDKNLIELGGMSFDDLISISFNGTQPPLGLNSINVSLDNKGAIRFNTLKDNRFYFVTVQTNKTPIVEIKYTADIVNTPPEQIFDLFLSTFKFTN